MESYASMPLQQDDYYHSVPEYYESHHIDGSSWEEAPVPNHFLFDFYVHKEAQVQDYNNPASTVLVKRAAKHLSGYVNSPPPDLFSHLSSLYSLFHLDEEVFISYLF